MMYFDFCTNLNELKSEYRKLALKNHPDRGGKVEVMAKINNDYDQALKRISVNDFNVDDTTKTVNFDDLDDGFREVIQSLINLEGVNIELCGSWVWISGNTKQYKKILKESGCFWAPNKKLWYWRPKESAVRCSSGIKDMSYIRTVYGSEKIITSKKYYLKQA